MIVDYNHNQQPPDIDADIVIVGAGAVGLSMAANLVRSGQRVLVIEAGGEQVTPSSQAQFQSATSTGHWHEGIHSGRYRVLGGTTHFWGGQLVEFDPIVFEQRSWVSDTGWPITSGSVQPYYSKAMSLLGMDRCIHDDRELLSALEIVSPDFGPDLTYFFTRWAKTTNLARLFTQEIQSELSTILINASVVGFSCAEDGRTHKLQLRSLSGKAGIVRAKQIVLACGTLEICRLLLLPYIDGTRTPWNGNSWLGRGYLDHLDVVAGNVRVIDRQQFDRLFENVFLSGFKYNPKIKLSEYSQRRENLLGAAGAFVFKTSYKQHAENLKLFLRSLANGKLPRDSLQILPHILGVAKVSLPLVWRYLRSNRMFHPSGTTINFRITTELKPTIESRITLTDLKDELGVPQLNLNWSITGEELKTISFFAQSLGERLRGLGIAHLDLDPLLEAGDAAILDRGDDTNHQMGGARMSASPSNGVVDPNLKLYGSENIYVAGAAVMPTTGFANCTLTAIALGLKLCDHLRSLG